MTKYPQVLVNVPGVDKARVAASPELAAAVAAAEQQLGTTGRVLVRPSGTEPAVRGHGGGRGRRSGPAGGRPAGGNSPLGDVTGRQRSVWVVNGRQQAARWT